MKIPHRYRDRVAALWQARQKQIIFAAVVGVLLLIVSGFWELAEEVHEDGPLAWDAPLLQAFRRPDNPAIPIGPAYLQSAALDVTALGSPLVLTLFIAASVGFLYFEGQRRVAAITAVTVGSGAMLSFLLKRIFDRPRPDVVPHLQVVMSSSFPSGHTLGAAVVYLTLGVMFMKSFHSRTAKAFCLFWALFLTLIVGLSRIFLGVHYPSDVLAGWMAGAGWALACWAVAQILPTRPLPATTDETTSSDAVAQPDR